MNERIIRTVTGHEFRQSGDLDLSRPATNIANAQIGAVAFEITAGSSLLFDDLLAARPGTQVESRSELGGMVHTGHVPIKTPEPGVQWYRAALMWVGESGSFLIHAGRDIDPLLAVLHRLDIEDTDHGVVLRFKRSTDRWVSDPEIVSIVDGIGHTVYHPLTRAMKPALPTWAGRQLPHGELFRLPGLAHSHHFVYLAETCVVDIEASPSGDFHAIEANIAGMEVAWSYSAA